MRGRPAQAWVLFTALPRDVQVVLTVTPGLALVFLSLGAQPTLAFKLLLSERVALKFCSFFVREVPVQKLFQFFYLLV